MTMLLSRCRFDRELVFPLPSVAARTSILGIHTAKWREPPSKELRQDLANLCVGYCGADLKARPDTAQGALLDTQALGMACAPSAPPNWRALLPGAQPQQADFRSWLERARECFIMEWAASASCPHHA